MPLTSQPDFLWGLSFEDLPWTAGALIVDVAIWHGASTVVHRLLWMAGPSTLAGTMAWLRVEERSIPQWVWLWARYQIRPKRYLP